MKVRVLKAYGLWVPGDIFPDMPSGQAHTLIARGLIEEMAEAKPVEIKGKTKSGKK